MLLDLFWLHENMKIGLGSIYADKSWPCRVSVDHLRCCKGTDDLLDCMDSTQYGGQSGCAWSHPPRIYQHERKLKRWQGTVVPYYRTILLTHSEGYNLKWQALKWKRSLWVFPDGVHRSMMEHAFSAEFNGKWRQLWRCFLKKTEECLLIRNGCHLLNLP